VDYGRRMTAHHNDPTKSDLTPGYKIENLNYFEARALEQMLMSAAHTKNWIYDNGKNLINGISPKNKNLSQYIKAAGDFINIDYYANYAENEILNLIEFSFFGMP
jgi:hypothetical protein